MTTANNQQDLKNAQSTFNATVPNDAPIQPAQAFVDNIFNPFAPGSAGFGAGEVHLQNKSITYILPELLSQYLGITGGTVIDLSGNMLGASNVDDILAALANSGISDGSLDLSGGTNAAPTGQGLTDKATLIAAGWAVTTN